MTKETWYNQISMVACSKHCEAFVMAMRTWSWKVGNFSRNESSYEKAITAATPGFYLEWEHQKNIRRIIIQPRIYQCMKLYFLLQECLGTISLS